MPVFFFNYDRIGNIINMEKLYQMRYEDDLKKTYIQYGF